MHTQSDMLYQTQRGHAHSIRHAQGCTIEQAHMNTENLCAGRLVQGAKQKGRDRKGWAGHGDIDRQHCFKGNEVSTW